MNASMNLSAPFFRSNNIKIGDAAGRPPDSSTTLNSGKKDFLFSRKKKVVLKIIREVFLMAKAKASVNF